MEKKTISIPYEILSPEELSGSDALLVDTAREASFRSYAPYSKFSVGAAILLDNGEIVPGSNQENVAFPSGTCAERSACFYAHARYPEAKFRKIAIAARGTDGEFTPVPHRPPAAVAARRCSNMRCWPESLSNCSWRGRMSSTVSPRWSPRSPSRSLNSEPVAFDFEESGIICNFAGRTKQ